MGGVPCVLERFVDLACEVSVIVARDDSGASITWPVAENRHRDGILDVSIAPARVDDALADRARGIATGVARALDYRGVLCVEMFVTRGGEILVNEMAPRPHNSGHYTIDACATSQFEQQARVLAGLSSAACSTRRGHGERARRRRFDGPQAAAARARLGARAAPLARSVRQHETGDPRWARHQPARRSPTRSRPRGGGSISAPGPA
jgi:hypothetical protein